MTIYHIEFAKTGVNLSGGEVCMLELISYFSSMGHNNVLLTTDNGESTYKKNLSKKTNVIYKTISSYKSEKKYGFFISYIYRTFLAHKLIRNLDNIKSEDLVICHSDFFPNSISNYLLLNKFKSVNSAAFFHMKSPKIFFGYEGEFTKKLQLPRPTIIHYSLNQYLYKLLMKKHTIIFTVNDYYKLFLNRKYPKNKIIVLNSYGNGNFVKKRSDKKIYDLIWVGRFHAQKGLLDFIEIVKLVKKSKPNIRAVILGDGGQKIKDKLKKSIKNYELENNIELAGFVTGSKKLKYYSQSKVFAITSTYESFGQVILEAMSAGLPVIAYDLPVYTVFDNNIVTVNIGDKNKFALNINILLSDSIAFKNQSIKSIYEANNHSWATTAKTIINSYAKN